MRRGGGQERGWNGVMWCGRGCEGCSSQPWDTQTRKSIWGGRGGTALGAADLAVEVGRVSGTPPGHEEAVGLEDLGRGGAVILRYHFL